MQDTCEYEFVIVLAYDKTWVAMQFDDLQQPYLEVSAANAMAIADSIRAMVGQLFGPLIEPVPETGQTRITVSADRSTVQIEVHARTKGMRALVMQPEGWLWFANRLEDSSSLSGLPGNC